jgi:signal transduction histidine kinase
MVVEAGRPSLMRVLVSRIPRRFGLRKRLALIAALVVGAALVTGTLLLVGLLRSRLEAATTTAAELRATDVAALVASGAVPERLAFVGEETALVQVVSPGGVVVAATDNVVGMAPVSRLHPTGTRPLATRVRVEALDRHDEFRLVAVRVLTPNGEFVVYAGEALEANRETVGAITTLLMVGIPALLALVALITWWAAGRALLPVRRVTELLSDITTSDLNRRVPETGALDEIGMLTTTVNATLGRLDVAVARQRRFVADASHELRGPLASLRADLEISVEHPDHTPWGTVVANTVIDIERLQQLTNDLLLLARVDATHIPHHASVDLVALAGAAVAARPGGFDLRTIGFDRPVCINGNRSQLDRLIRNLIDNAVNHAVDNVTVSIEEVDGAVHLRVSDDGPGIPPEDRERVFEPFVRLDDARTRDSGGTGLGLAIVHDIATSHSAAVSVADTRRGGAEITVSFPVAIPPVISTA